MILIYELINLMSNTSCELFNDVCALTLVTFVLVVSIW
jgi:hypothetical protein